MIRALRALFAAATIAVIGLGGFYLIERKQAREAPAAETTEPISPEAMAATAMSPEALRDAQKKARESAKLAVRNGCTALRADYEVWDDYLDKKTRRKLKALIAKCDKDGEAQVSAEP